ncbi:MAG: DUF3300 domain-containing protein [Desulfurivibrionaceae bacterium]
MKTIRAIMRRLAWTFIAIFIISLGATARPAGAQEEEGDRFRKEELVQMLAPIALYPDSLIAQILMASTYPLEVVEAERWRRDNQTLQGDALSEALREKPWDPSVKSLCYFPDVLIAMSEKLDQTRKLGDAFLVQEQEVMDTIQELRQKAREQGTLQTTAEQKVIVERETILIEPASPQVVYVPVYDPYYVYGSWWYPSYPPYYWYYPRHHFASDVYFSFGPRVFIGSGIFSWVWFDWQVHRIHIDVPKTFFFHRHRVRPSRDRLHWRHDPRHRRGVAYRDRRTGERFGLPTLRRRSLSPETRGFPAGTVSTPDRQRTITPERRRQQQRVQPDLRGGREQQRAQPAPQRQREQLRIPPDSRGRSEPQRIIRPAPSRSPSFGRDTTFRGINAGRSERRAGERGQRSRRGGESRRQDDGGRR